MKKLMLISLVAIGFTGPAFAAATCTIAPQSQWKSQTELKTMLSKQGLTVSNIKTENGCYEVYAKDASGKRVNAAYNAKTLQKVGNAEAGEG